MQREALETIKAQSGLTIGWLAYQLGTTPQGAGRVVAKLSALDLVHRERDPNDEWAVRFTCR